MIKFLSLGALIICIGIFTLKSVDPAMPKKKQSHSKDPMTKSPKGLDAQIQKLDHQFLAAGGVQALNDKQLSVKDRRRLLAILKDWQDLKTKKLKRDLKTTLERRSL